MDPDVAESLSAIAVRVGVRQESVKEATNCEKMKTNLKLCDFRSLMNTNRCHSRRQEM